MRAIHLLVALMLLAAIQVDLVVATQASPQATFWVLLLVGMLAGQVGLLAGWLVLGGWHLLLRLVLVFVLVGLSAALLGAASNPPWAEWFGLLCLYVMIVGLVLLCLRLAGMRLFEQQAWGRLARASDALLGPLELQRWQFSLGGLLASMTAVALLLAAARWMSFPWEHAVAALAYVGGFVGITLLALWLSWARCSFWLRGGVALPAIALVGGLLGDVEGMVGAWPFVMMASAQAGCVLAGSLVLQLGGCRIGWDARRKLEVANARLEVSDRWATPERHHRRISSLRFGGPRRRALSRT